MNSLRRSLSASLLLAFLSIFTLQAVAAPKRPIRPAKRARVEKRAVVRTSRADRRRAAARRRAEMARRAAIARQRAAEAALRARVQALIAKDDPTGEDPEIRRIVIDALGEHAGTVVVMNPKTGRVYSIVNQQWAMREGFKPCSTIKLVTALAGLNERVIDPADTTAISDSNKVDLTRALAYSKNEYFQTVGGEVGFSKMISYARLLGFGEKTGVNARSETAGRVPKSKTGPAVNHMSSHGDDFKVTALQLATMVSAIANGGELLAPFVARRPQDERQTPKVRRRLNLEPDSFQRLLPGMIGSVKYGSGKLAFDPQATVAGKTGTCIENGTWVGLFTSYAPLNDPQLAIAVIARGNDGRHHFPAAVAGRIYRQLNGRMLLAGTNEIASRQPQTVSPSEAEVDDDDEADNSSDEGDDSALSKSVQPQTVWGDQQKPIASKVRPTVMAIPARTPTPEIKSIERQRRVGGKQN